MKRRSPHAFTLIEMVTVVAVIIVLAGIVMGVAGFVQTKGAREKGLTQLKNMQYQCGAFREDNGGYPENQDTTNLDPREHFSPISGASGTLYIASSRWLYSCLSGDFEPALKPDGRPEEKSYYPFKRDELNFKKDASGGIAEVRYLQDPFGNSYAYSTAGAQAEAEYRKKLKLDPTTERPTKAKGYNPTYDLWSTGNGTTSSHTGKWIKNWGS
ncbi:MAG: type II secretion system protein [Chthoniobacteraceae bacterium]